MAAVTAIVGTAVAVGGAAIADGKAHRAMRSARGRKRMAYNSMQTAIDERQEITNPYAGISDLSSLASDLSGQIQNPFENLQVSTAAAEMKAEEADISLANTLDYLEQTGASAGGATALAMAALKGKKDVAATIEEQEAKNAELRARGEQHAIDARVAATTRHQDILIEQGEREQNATAQGELFQFQAQEARTNADINMYSAQYQGFANQQNNARIAGANAWSSAASAVGGIASSVIGAPKGTADFNMKT